MPLLCFVWWLLLPVDLLWPFPWWLPTVWEWLVIFPAILNRCKGFDLSQFTTNSLNSESSKIQNLTNNLAICELLQIKLVSIDVRISELKVKWLQRQSLQLISFFVHQSLDLRVLRATWWLLNYVTCCNRGTRFDCSAFGSLSYYMGCVSILNYSML